VETRFGLKSSCDAAKGYSDANLATEPSEHTIAETYAQERIDGYEIVFDWNEQKAEEAINPYAAVNPGLTNSSHRHRCCSFWQLWQAVPA
jgi:hypothetical protein